MRGVVADLCAAAADSSRSRGLSPVCCNIPESRRRFEVCPCGSESTPPEASFQLCVVNEQSVFEDQERHVCVCASHHSGRVAVVDLEAGHGLDDGHHRLDGVAVDHRSVLFALVL